jgi:hypothetical protein
VDRPNSLPNFPALDNLATRHEEQEHFVDATTARHTREERSEYSGATQEYFSVGEIAVRLGCSRDTVLRRFANEPGVIDLAPKGARKRMLRIPLAALNRFLAKSGVTNQLPDAVCPCFRSHERRTSSSSLSCRRRFHPA